MKKEGTSWETAPFVRKHQELILERNPNDVILKRYFPSSVAVAARIAAQVAHASAEEIEEILDHLHCTFRQRHAGLLESLRHRAEEVLPRLCDHLSEAVRMAICGERDVPRRTALGSYFMHEYSIDCAALFNPSIVDAPATESAPGPDGGKGRDLIMSLRACGEGHISSIIFRRVRVDGKGSISVLPVTDATPLHCGRAIPVIDGTPDPQAPQPPVFWNPVTGHEFLLNSEEFMVVFPAEVPLERRVLFPVVPSQSNGIEDARFVQFINDDGSKVYYATFTAFNGRVIQPQIIETKDFREFFFAVPKGSAVANKGMALFPRRINGKYWMLSRQDDENVMIMSSDSVLRWENPAVLLTAQQPWEMFKMGNCGSPLETPRGWLVLTHGVGPMRRYCIGAAMLDLNDPTRVVGRMRQPLIAPNEVEREGYVPNVVYSCGALLHGGDVIIPYAMSDSATSFAAVSLEELYAAMNVNG